MALRGPVEARQGLDGTRHQLRLEHAAAEHDFAEP